MTLIDMSMFHVEHMNNDEREQLIQNDNTDAPSYTPNMKGVPKRKNLLNMVLADSTVGIEDCIAPDTFDNYSQKVK